MLVERARQRVNYPRPWGIPVSLTDSDAAPVEEEERKDVSPEEGPDERSADMQIWMEYLNVVEAKYTWMEI